MHTWVALSQQRRRLQHGVRRVERGWTLISNEPLRSKYRESLSVSGCFCLNIWQRSGSLGMERAAVPLLLSRANSHSTMRKGVQ